MNSQKSDESGDGPHLSEARGTRLSPGTDERFQEFRDDKGYTNAEAMRQLVRDGLDLYDVEQSDTLRSNIEFGVFAMLLAIFPVAATGRWGIEAGLIVAAAYGLYPVATYLYERRPT